MVAWGPRLAPWRDVCPMGSWGSSQVFFLPNQFPPIGGMKELRTRANLVVGPDFLPRPWWSSTAASYVLASFWFVLPVQLWLYGQAMDSAFKTTNELRGTSLQYMYHLVSSPYKCFMLLSYLHRSRHSHCLKTQVSIFYAGSDR